MSIEQALAENTAAINALIGVWSKLNAQANHIDVTAPGDTVVAAGKTVAAKPEKAVAKQEPKPDPKRESAAEPSAPEAPAAQTASSSEPVDYPTLQKAVFALAGKSREAAAAVAASMGVKTFKELDQSKWADALVAVNAKLAELEAA
jgi:type IV secretory pathway VirB10-like protein